jgi:small subunit ribosomal protein S9
MSETDAPTATLDAPRSGDAPEAPAQDQEQEQARPLAEPAKPDAGGFVWGTGRRKSAVARVRVRPATDEGSGKFLISGPKAKDREIDAFFSEPQHRAACRRPLEATSMIGKLDIFVNVQGGGYTGQAEAILLGVARALKGYDPTLEQTLRDENLLTRDPREVERKKYGQRGARRRFQFSKR